MIGIRWPDSLSSRWQRVADASNIKPEALEVIKAQCAPAERAPVLHRLHGKYVFFFKIPSACQVRRHNNPLPSQLPGPRGRGIAAHGLNNRRPWMKASARTFPERIFSSWRERERGRKNTVDSRSCCCFCCRCRLLFRKD